MNQTIPISFFERFPVSCGTTTRHFPLKIANARQLSQRILWKSAQEFLNLKPERWVQAGQIHGAAVALLDGNASPSPSPITILEDTDGLITTARETLSILTADCLPLFFYLEDPPAVGLIHAGWRGTARRIVENAVFFFGRLSKNAPQRLRVAFGASIGTCCYEVGAELEEFFPRQLEKRGNRLYLDLVKENRRQLLEAGILPERIGEAGPCCGCHLGDFYSYRKERERAYRMLSWIALDPET